MRNNPNVKLSGDHNECAGCGALFNSTAAFDRHRTGSFSAMQRRCLTEPEMLVKGMAKNGRGWWVRQPGNFSDGRWGARMPFAASRATE